MIVGVIGRARSGKNTVAKIAAEVVPNVCGQLVEELAFADPLKKFCQEVYDFSDEQLWGPSEERNKPDVRYPRPHGFVDPTGTGSVVCDKCGKPYDVTSRVCSYLTPREALQTLGTEWGRKCWPDTWLALGIRRARAAELRGRLVFITDCRFVNEGRVIKEEDGLLWRVERPGTDGASVGVAGHASEMEQESEAMLQLVDVDIINDGDLDLLRTKVLVACRSIKSTSR